MGAGPNVNSFFGIVTFLIAIVAGVMVFNWILTMYKGKVQFSSPMYWFIGFLILFTIGGMGGLSLASPPADFQLHNTLFLVAHFHTMIVGVALFGIFAAVNYWFPKIFGFKLDEQLDKQAFWLWIIGYFVAFIPMYLLGFMGTPRRIDHYSSANGWQPLYIVCLIGFVIICLGICTQLYQLIWSIKNRDKLRDTTGDPWNGRTLEWSTTSPPPFYNFAVLPTVTAREEFWEMKKRGIPPVTKYEDFHMPKHTGMGIVISVICLPGRVCHRLACPLADLGWISGYHRLPRCAGLERPS